MANPSMTEKEDVYSRVTNKIVADLEKGELTWLKPWEGGTPPRPMRANGEPYRGVNILMLWFAAMEKGYNSPYWMTYKQAEELGGQVRKGEKGSHVVYANTVTKTETNAKGEEVEKQIPFLKTYSVFNVEQIEGLPEKFYVKYQTPTKKERSASAEQFFKNTGAKIRHGGGRAYYSQALDTVQMPEFERFHDELGYYGTLAHEVTHWTGHPSRENREFGKRFGDDNYAMEELVAELGAAFLCADLGIAPLPREDTAAYLQSWLKVLKADKHAIFTAASQAQKAADFLHQQQEKEQGAEQPEKSTYAEKARLIQGRLELQ